MTNKRGIMFKKPDKTTIDILISQAFSAQNDRIKLQEQQINALKNEVIALNEDLKNAWSVMQKMDEKLSTAYAAALGGVDSEPITMTQYKFGEDVNDADKS